MQGADVGVMPQFCNMAVQWIHRQTEGGGEQGCCLDSKVR